ncbi:MAG: hypothetical protein AMXMBFR84_06270 [Candidatus Hydrogenedentota bacterium]
MPPEYQLMGIHPAHRIGLLLLSLALLAAVLELVRRGYLKERYALLWLVTSGAGLVVGVFPNIIVAVSNWLHFQYLTLLFAMYFIFTLGIVLSFTVVISRLSERNRTLAQEVALLAKSVDALEKRKSGP